MIRLTPRAKLSIRPGVRGAWCYAATAGRISVEPTLGSVATHIRSGFGGIAGRALVRGDVLPVTLPQTLNPALRFKAPSLDRPGDVIRVVLGPQDDYFASDQIAAFLQGPWTVSSRSDRMAYLLEGAPVIHGKGFNIVSDGIAMGAIQIPGSGQPIVLMADRQPTACGFPLPYISFAAGSFGRLPTLASAI